MINYLLTTAVDHISEGIQIINREWRYVYLNKSALKHSKFPLEKLVGYRMQDKYPGIEKTDMFRKLELCMENKISTKIENEFTYPDGSKGWFELSIQAVPEGICILSIDITERKKAFNEIFNLNSNLKTKIESRNKELELKNKYVMDSLHYAKKIQKAFLQNKSEISSIFPNSLLLYKPKDIVSGDFYFFQEFEDKIVLVAADCTGHGVPGALVSMIGIEKLKSLVLTSNDCSQLLEELNKSIKIALSKSNEEEYCQDGMDVAVCCFDKKNQTISFAGANRPFWLIRDKGTNVEEIKATKRAIGGFTDDNQHFDTHKLKLELGDTFYIFSDGYADTFGALSGKKLMKGKFKEILLEIQKQTMQEQELYLDKFIEDWKGGTEQIDDILVIGIRL